MGIDGLFLGGAAEGMQNAQLMGLKERAVAADERKGLLDEVDSAVDGTMKIISSVVDAGRKAGKTPVQIKQAISPLISDITGLYTKSGRDPSRLLNQIDVLATAPVAQEGPSTEIGKMRQDVSRGYVPQDVYDASIEKATRPEKGPNTMESIFQKIATGSELTPGEQTLYDDRKKAAQGIWDFLNNPGGTPSVDESPSTTTSSKLSAATSGAKQVQATVQPSFNSEEEARKALKEGKINKGDVIIIKGNRIVVK